MKKTVTINDFPNELLILVFKRLYKLHRHNPRMLYFFSYSGAEDSDEDISSPDPKTHWLGDPFDPSMFPYAQAKVCQRWYALLADRPTYWTRIPITIGSVTTPLPTVANYFAWTRGLPIQVFVKRHPDDRSAQDPDEKSYVAGLLPYISQNIQRIRGLEFSLLHHASLPDIRPWLAGKADILESLHVNHKERRVNESIVPLGEGTDHRDDGERVQLEFTAPRLTSLSIDAQTFARACRSGGTWLANAPRLTRLRLIPSGPSSPIQHLSIAATIRALSLSAQLRFLSVRGINFLDDYVPPETPAPTPEIYPGCLTFEDLTGTAVSTFFFAAGTIDALDLRNCSLHGLESIFAASMRLLGFNEERDLTIPFRDVVTYGVAFADCPALNDTFLDFMAVSPTGDDFPAKTMCSLHIRNCTNFHVENLYNMVFARRRAIESNPAWDGTPVHNIGWAFDDSDLRAISTLVVQYGPRLSEEYRRKFEELVHDFSWIDATEDKHMT